MDQLRQLLKLARLEQGLSFDDLAQTLQVSSQTLAAFEAGSTIEADVLFGLVNLLNVSPEVVLPLVDQIGWNINDETNIELLVSRKV